MNPPPPFRPVLPPAMAAAVERFLVEYRALMRDHNAGRGEAAIEVLHGLDLTLNELVLLADTIGHARRAPSARTVTAVQALADAAAELATACRKRRRVAEIRKGLRMSDPEQGQGADLTRERVARMCWVYRPRQDDGDEGGCPGFCDEGWTYDCIDGCCVDPESGCSLCRRRCDYCWERKPVDD